MILQFDSTICFYDLFLRFDYTIWLMINWFYHLFYDFILLFDSSIRFYDLFLCFVSKIWLHDLINDQSAVKVYTTSNIDEKGNQILRDQVYDKYLYDWRALYNFWPRVIIWSQHRRLRAGFVPEIWASIRRGGPRFWYSPGGNRTRQITRCGCGYSTLIEAL